MAPSPIALGTAPYGSDIPAEESLALLDAYAEAGGNFLDTAHIYGAWREGGWGASERTLGEWIRTRGMRDRVVLATKGGTPPLDDLSKSRLTEEEIRRDLEESLDRLGVEYIDLYWLHRDNPERPVDGIVEALARFRREGLIRCYGASNWTPERLESAREYAERYGHPPFVASQPGWSLVDFARSEPFFPGMLYLDAAGRRWHERTGLPVVAYTSQASGYFGRENVAWAQDGFPGEPPRAKHFDAPANRARLLRAIDLAREKGCTPNQINLAYLLSQPFPVFPIVGNRDPGRLREAMEAAALRLTPAECAALRGEDG